MAFKTAKEILSDADSVFMSWERSANESHTPNQISGSQNGAEFNMSLVLSISILSAVCLSLLIVCLVLIVRRFRHDKLKSVNGKTLSLDMKTSQPFNVTALPSQYVYSDEAADGGDEDIPFNMERRNSQSESNLFQLSMNLPQMGDPRGKNQKECIRTFPSTPTLNVYDSSPGDGSCSANSEPFPRIPKSVSVENMSFLRPRKVSKLRRRTRSDDSDQCLSDAGDVETSIMFDATHCATEETLKVTVHGLYDVPRKSYARKIFVIVALIPNYEEEERRSRLVNYVENFIKIEEDFLFKDITHEKLDTHTLRISVYSKKQSRTPGKSNFLGELFINCSEINWSRPENPTMIRPAPRKRIKKHSTADKLLKKTLGELLVELQYQPLANRIKVFIRKTDNLPNIDKLAVVKPVFYVVVKLVKDGDILERQRTSGLSGKSSVVFNQAFLFNLGLGDINEFSLEFDVMREKRGSRDAIVGRVLIGKESSKSGKQHWNSMIFPRSGDVARWHNLLPVFVY